MGSVSDHCNKNEYHNKVSHTKFVWFFSASRGFPGGTVVKSLPANAGNARDTDSTSESGRSPGEENGNLLQHSCLENPMDRGDWWLQSMGSQKSQTEHTHT